MSDINNEEKQNINNIKNLYKLNTEGKIPSLFHEVKKAKQQLFALASTFKDKLQETRKIQEENAKKLVEQEKKPVEPKIVRQMQPEETVSFAELFAMNENKKETQKAETLVAKEDEKKAEKTEGKKDEVPSITKTDFVKKDQSKPFSQNREQRQNGFNSQNANGNFQRQNGFNQQRPQFNQNGFNKPFQNGQRPQYNNPNFQNGQRPQYNNFQNAQRPQFGNQNGFNRPFNGQRPQYNNPNFQNGQRKPYVPGQSSNPLYKGQNKTLLNIVPKKTNNLTDAMSVFATKERSFGNKKKTSERSGEDEKRINKKSLLRRGLIEEQNIEERMVTRKLKLKKTKTDVTPQVFAPITNAVITTQNLTVKILSEKIGKPVTEIIKQLMLLGIMTTINSPIDFETAELVANELGITLELKVEKSYEEKLKENANINDSENTDKRPPIVTIVGHVDHGKTSLLDYIRKTKVTSNEAGGITQSIGAYSISWKGENITFIDTPGHEAFINMRKRGTEITDVAVLIVAADDGIKPQTIEAIKHVKEAKVPMIVAITKIDKANVDIERIKQQLAEQEVLPEEWGGDTILVPVSSVTGEGIDKLLEIILLVAEMQSLKCNKKRPAIGTVIEAELDKNRGPIANIVVQNGVIKIGDYIVSGLALGKVRALIDDKGKNVQKAGPSMPVSILGFDSVPKAGDTIQVVDEKFSKNIIEERKIKMAQDKIENGMPKGLDDFLSTPVQEDKKSLNLLIKANSQGSAEALKQSLLDIQNEEVKVEVVYCGVGNITENDIQMAKVSNATIIAFDTKVMAKISNFAKQNKIEIKEYNIIYKAIEDIEKVLKSMMAPKFEEKISGHAEVRALFKISKVGTIAGSYVLDGKIVRNSEVKVYRKDKVVFEGKLGTLKREKDDVKEVAAGYECGIKVEDFNDFEEGDIIECIVKQQINL